MVVGLCSVAPCASRCSSSAPPLPPSPAAAGQAVVRQCRCSPNEFHTSSSSSSTNTFTSSSSGSGRRRRSQLTCSASAAPAASSASGSGRQPTAGSPLYLPGQRNSQLGAGIAAAATGTADGVGCSVTPTGWHPLDTPAIWKGTEEQAVFRQATPYPLSPSWKVILLSDGSVTRHLQLMTNQRVEVECLEMRSIGHERAGLPPDTAQIEGPLVQRQVMLHIPDPHSKAYVYASSWWNEDTVDQYLRDRSQPIWVSLSQGRTELYRDILQLEHGNCPFLEERFQTAGPFWGRQYLFWHGRRPLTLIYEVFSTALEEFLGPTRLQT